MDWLKVAGWNHEMSELNITIAHQLTQEEAINRIKALLGEVKQQYAETIRDLREEWSGNTNKFGFAAMGFAVTGVITVQPTQVDFSGTLPFAASFFKGKIESVIRERAEKLLA
jgi:hypothetical protein